MYQILAIPPIQFWCNNKYMREIKFRAWDGIEKKMYEVKEIKFIGLRSEPYKVFIEFGYQVEEPTLMQYTGLKDKNGKEIYEGDIITIDEDERKYVIKFCKGVFGFVAQDSRHYPIRDFGANNNSICDGSYAGSISVIGNIYENPELLPTQPQDNLTPPQA